MFGRLPVDALFLEGSVIDVVRIVESGGGHMSIVVFRP